MTPLRVPVPGGSDHLLSGSILVRYLKSYVIIMTEQQTVASVSIALLLCHILLSRLSHISNAQTFLGANRDPARNFDLVTALRSNSHRTLDSNLGPTFDFVLGTVLVFAVSPDSGETGKILKLERDEDSDQKRSQDWKSKKSKAETRLGTRLTT
ncbi:hypothetical protein EVAR_52392_1 [Eumeta japonica]|uniref:Uncharacterized protein n=1 Tax=Eumeta variegata TaxID=151549 RepID=A0A4C1ZIM6_EUMVA|nr:hypothetical protein EVAR_52392_1 [Eumeta japonica]